MVKNIMAILIVSLVLGCSASNDVICKISKRSEAGRIAEQTVYQKGKELAKIIYDDRPPYTQKKVQGTIPDGIVKYLSDEGNLVFEIEFKNNKKDGLMKYYEKDGRLAWTQEMKGDATHGEYNAFYDSGKVAFKRNYKNGKLDAESYTYLETGEINYIKTYKDGVLIKEGYVDNKNE
ncbi:hypothetical protein K8S19_13685 [bacterium]|nr:hypothetical protein [bacterium]